MKKNVLAVFALAALSLTACKKENSVENTEVTEINAPSADAAVYKVNAADSNIEWVGTKLTGDTHNGTIKLGEGEVDVLEGKVTNGKFVIDMNTIEVADLTEADKKAGLEGHLKGATEENSDHFFNVKKFPTATFEISSVVEENGKQLVTGNLTIKEKTEAVKFPAVITVTDTDVTIVSDEFEIDRTKFGVNYNSGSIVKDLGDKAIKDEVKIKLNVKALK